MRIGMLQLRATGALMKYDFKEIKLIIQPSMSDFAPKQFSRWQLKLYHVCLVGGGNMKGGTDQWELKPLIRHKRDPSWQRETGK